MADERAQVSLTFDASGAQKGAADFKAAGDAVIATERAVEAASAKAAGSIEQNERSKAAVRQAGARAAKAAGQADVEAAALAGNVWATSTQRVLTSTSSIDRTLRTMANRYDLFGKSARDAQRDVDRLSDIIAKGGPKAEEAARYIAAAQAKLAAAQREQADPGGIARLEQQTRRVEELARKYDPLGVAVRQAKKDVEDLNKAMAGGGQNASIAAAAAPGAQRHLAAAQKAQTDVGIDPALADQKKMIEELTRVYDPLGTAVAGATKRVQDLQKVITEGGPHAAEATKLLAHAQNELTEAQAKQAAGDPKLLAERKALEAEFAPLKARTDEYNAALTRLQKSVAMGIVTDQQAEVQRKQLTAQFERDKEHIDHAEKGMTKLGHSTAGVKREMLVLSHELLMGNFTRLGGSLMVMAELAGGVGAALSGVAKFLVTPMGLAIAGIAAVTAAVLGMGVAAERSQRQLMDMRNQLSGIRPDFGPAAESAQRASRHLAAQTDMGSEDARQMVKAITTSPQFRGTEDDTIKLGKLFNDLSKQMGGDAAKAAEYAKQAFESPSKLAAELGKTLQTLDPRFQKHLADLEAEGKKAQASTELIRRLAESVKPVQSNMTELMKEWHRFNEILFDTSTGSHTFVDAVGGAVDHIAAGAVRQMGIILDMVKSVFAWMEAHTPDWIKKGLKFMWENGPVDIAKMGIDAVTGGGAQPGSASTGGPVAVNDDAVGLFQLRRDAATDVGLSVPKKGVAATPENDQRFNYSMNLLGGERYFRQQYEAFGGNIDNATRGYNQGTAGAQKGLGFDYLAKVKAADPSQLPSDVKKDIEDAFYKLYSDIARTAAGPKILARIEQIAMVENRGSHYDLKSAAAATTPHTTGGTAAGSSLEPAPGSIVDVPNEASQRAREEYEKSPAISRQLEENRQAIKRTTDGLIEDVKALEKARADHNAEAAKLAEQAVTRDQETLRLLQAQRTDILTPAQRAAREATEGLQPLSAEPGAARQFEELRLKQQQRDRESPYDNAADNARERAALQAKLTAELKDTTDAMDLQIAAQQRLIPMYEAGGQAAEHLANVEKARIEALKYGVRGTDEYTAAMKRLTAEYDRNTGAARDTQAAQSIARMKQETEQMRLQLGLVGATNAERDQQTAMLQQRQQLGLGSNDVANEEQQKAINLSGQNAGLRTQVEQTRAAYAELEQTGERVFDTFEKAMTEPLRQGETAADRFKQTMISVLADIEKELLKLAVINPLMNALFGGNHRPELGDVGGLLGGLLGGKQGQGGGQGGGGSGGGSGGGGSGGGLLGNLFEKGSSLLGKYLFGGTSGGRDAFGSYTGTVGDPTPGGDALSSVMAAMSDNQLSQIANTSSDAMGAGWSSGAASAADSAFGAAGAFHTGGVVGVDGAVRMVPASLFFDAPRFHAGLGANEFTAILERGERVLTGQQQRQVAAAANNNNGGGGGHSFTFNFPHTTNADSFRRAGTQVASHVSSTLARASARNK